MASIEVAPVVGDAGDARSVRVRHSLPRMGEFSVLTLTGHAAIRACWRASSDSAVHASDESERVHARPSMTVPGWLGLKTLRT